MEKSKTRVIKKRLALLLAFIMIFSSIIQVSAFAEFTAGEMAPRAADPPPNWEDPEPEDPNYWAPDTGAYIRDTNILYTGLRYRGVSEDKRSYQLEYINTMSASDLYVEFIEFKIDSKLMPYVHKVSAQSSVAGVWRDCVDMGEGVYRVPYYHIKGGVIAAVNAGALTTFRIPVEIIFQPGTTIDDIKPDNYIIQCRVKGTRSGKNFIAKETQGVGVTIIADPPGEQGISNWLGVPAFIRTEFDAETNILKYTWQSNPTVTYTASTLPKYKPFVLNVNVDPLIIQASEEISIHADRPTATGTSYTLNKNIFSENSDTGLS